MVANDIVLWFSVIVIALVALWAVLMIRAYNKVGKND
jgi:hypothetical protein